MAWPIVSDLAQSTRFLRQNKKGLLMSEQTIDVKGEKERDVFDLIYKLEDNPPAKEAMFAALQHLLAIIVGIITPTLIIGGVLGDGVNSAIAAMFNTFPNTTFSQNNGVIQLTGIASRYVGMYLAGFLVVLGLFPVIGAFFRSLPNPVLGGLPLSCSGRSARPVSESSPPAR